MDARAAGRATDAASLGAVSSPAATSLSALAEAARDGDREAEDRLWERARPWLLRTGLALGAPVGDVPDLVQDTLLAAHRHLSRFDSSLGSLEAWLSTILVRRVRNGARSRGRRARILSALRVVGLPSATPADATSASVESRFVLDRFVLQAVIDVDGKVRALSVLRVPQGAEDLAAAAADAVGQWRYRPALRQGVPVPVYSTIVVEFSLR